MIKHLKTTDYKVNKWSGGLTTEFAIYPQNSNYANRDFLWRISSATIEDEFSTFTNLPDYNRFIATLDNEIKLIHDDKEVQLSPLSIYNFDGGINTKSIGKCTDFNLMIRKNEVSATLDLHETSITIKNFEEIDTIIIYCISGNISLPLQIFEKETLILSDLKNEITITADTQTKYFVAKIYKNTLV